MGYTRIRLLQILGYRRTWQSVRPGDTMHLNRKYQHPRRRHLFTELVEAYFELNIPSKYLLYSESVYKLGMQRHTCLGTLYSVAVIALVALALVIIH